MIIKVVKQNCDVIGGVIDWMNEYCIYSDANRLYVSQYILFILHLSQTKYHKVQDSSQLKQFRYNRGLNISTGKRAKYNTQ